MQHFNRVFQRWNITRCSVHCSVDSRKSNIEFDAVPLHQNLTKCSKIKQAYVTYCVLNERGKFGANISLHHGDIVIFVLVYFNLNHPVCPYACLCLCLRTVLSLEQGLMVLLYSGNGEAVRVGLSSSVRYHSRRSGRANHTDSYHHHTDAASSTSLATLAQARTASYVTDDVIHSRTSSAGAADVTGSRPIGARHRLLGTRPRYVRIQQQQQRVKLSSLAERL